jgi:pyruvate formate lyase activating enzyme
MGQPPPGTLAACPAAFLDLGGENLTICALVSPSFVDYPGEMCTTVFFGGCNFRCPWCHNRPLVEEPWSLPEISYDEAISRLVERRNWVQAVCLTGGEPTLDPNLVDFVTQLKDRGFKVKLDTNGSRPGVLSRLLEAGLLDYVAMDIKSPPNKYQLLAGVPVEMAAIKSSIDLLKSGFCQYEFRTTVVPELLTEADLWAIGQWLSGASCYVLQRFMPQENIIQESYRRLPPGNPQFLHGLASQLQGFFTQVKVRD